MEIYFKNNSNITNFLKKEKDLEGPKSTDKNDRKMETKPRETILSRRTTKLQLEQSTGKLDSQVDTNDRRSS